MKISSHSYNQQLENRVKWLEDLLRKVAPEQLNGNAGGNLGQWSQENEPEPILSITAAVPGISGSHNAQVLADIPPIHGVVNPRATPVQETSPASASQIGPNEPLAHNVGLLSLANSKEPKYLGPSSGVGFARLIFAAVPPSQGLAAHWASSGRLRTRRNSALVQPLPVPSAHNADAHYFAEAYYETYQPLYPFLEEDTISDKVEALLARNLPLDAAPMVDEELSSLDLSQVLLVLALGAKTLESRLTADFSSEAYYTAAMQHLHAVSLHDSLQGVQVLLLLTLAGFHFEDGLNVWFLTSTIIASCLDLGLQRKSHDGTENNLRSGIFWSAYSLDRTLTVILGRPLTLRDEAIDIEFPGSAPAKDPEDDCSPSVDFASRGNGKRLRLRSGRIRSDPYAAPRYSFQFDQITAEIKLMLYRVAQSPYRFPWPTNISAWQRETHKECDTLLDSLTRDLRWRSCRSSTDRTLQNLQLKYHQCIMLLYRPTPAIQHPELASFEVCYNSAVETVLIYASMHRFANMPNTWLAAHAIFVSGITMLYCIWTCPKIRATTSFEDFAQKTAACSAVLDFLGKTWSVAEDARFKFDQLVSQTTGNWWSGENHNASGSATGILHPAESYQQGAAIQESIGIIPGVPAAPMAGPEDDLVVPDHFLGELGDMSEWFDLGWLHDVTLTSASMP